MGTRYETNHSDDRLFPERERSRIIKVAATVPLMTSSSHNGAFNSPERVRAHVRIPA